MSDAIGIPSTEIASKRRSRLAEFFIRLVREKPLGTISGIIILMLIFVNRREHPAEYRLLNRLRMRNESSEVLTIHEGR